MYWIVIFRLDGLIEQSIIYADHPEDIYRAWTSSDTFDGESLFLGAVKHCPLTINGQHVEFTLSKGY